MKRLLLIATTLFALTSGADAVEMPEELRDAWCYVSELSNRRQSIYSRSEAECDRDAMTPRNSMGVDARGFAIPNGDCRVLKLTQFGKRTYRIKFRCQDDSHVPLTVEHTWKVVKDRLSISHQARRR